MSRVEHFQDGSQQLDLFHDGFYAAGKDVRKKILDENQRKRATQNRSIKLVEE